MYETECIGQIEEDFQTTRQKCREVNFETVRNEKLFVKIEGRLMKVIAPLM